MKKIARRIALAAAVFLTIEVFGFTLSSKMGVHMKMKLHSKEEIMASMTPERALNMVLGMEGVQRSPELLGLIEGRFRAHGRRARRVAAFRGRVHRRAAQPSGYASLKPATDMLNTMVQEARMKLDLSQIQCSQFERSQMLMLEEAQRDVASFNGMAAEARGQVLHAQSEIGLLSMKIPQVQGELDEHRGSCSHELGVLQYQLRILMSDMLIVEKIVNMTSCSGPAAGSAFLQEMNMVECAHCANGGTVMLQHEDIQPLLQQLGSDISRGYLQQGLRSSFHEESFPAMALTQEQVHRQLRMVRSEPFNMSDSQSQDQSPERGQTEPVDCIPTTKCTLKPTSCVRLKEKFQAVHGGMLDKKDDLSEQLVSLERYCEQTDRGLSGQLSTMGIQVEETQANLAMSTKAQIDAESQASQKGRQHDDLQVEYSETLEKCCDEQNTERSEICALEQIRGELYSLAGHKVFITDCEVGEWSELECSVTCGGGLRRKTRDITVHPSELGSACPPLTVEESCNEQPCPIDCVLDDWSGWSACSAECGGGVRERSRSIRERMQNDGKPCGETEESEACHMESCDRDCVLSDWTGWSSCNRACGGGHIGRVRTIAEAARGTGTCATETDDSRMNFQSCNTFVCTSLLPQGRNVLNCNTKSDIVILLDSSGSLGSAGWQASQLMTQALVHYLQAEPSADVKVALYVFSAETSAWVTHLTTSTTVADAAATKWLMAGTYTHQALGEAESEFRYGREDAQSVVIVITDGFPYSQHLTVAAAERLKTKARVLWVPVGLYAPVALIQTMASKPTEDHMISVTDWNNFLTYPTINKIIASTCPNVK